MDFGLSEEQSLFQDSLNAYLGDRVGLERVRRIAAGKEDPQALRRELVEFGLSGLLVAERHGGVGLAPMDAAVAAECLGHHVTPAPFLGSSVVAPLALTLAGGQTERLQRLAAGELTIGLAFAEAVGARADAGLVAKGGKLSGKSLYVLDYGADEYLAADAERRLYLVAAAAVAHQPLATVDRTRRRRRTGFPRDAGYPAERRSRLLAHPHRHRLGDARCGHSGGCSEHA